ncbi:MAG: acyltransferase [Polyangiales bacterium]
MTRTGRRRSRERPTRAEAPRHEPAPAHLPALDGVRGVAALLVMLHHFALDPAVTTPAALRLVQPLRLAWCGVDLFFVLSGFLITRILLAARGGPGYYRRFLVRRALRIFPLYYATLLGVLVVAPALLPGVSAAPMNAHQHWLWLYLTNVGSVLRGTGVFTNAHVDVNHFWSLAIEEQFYLVWPAVVALGGARWLPRVCAVGLVAGLATRLALLQGDVSSQALYTLTPCRLDGLLLGALMAAAMVRVDGPRVLHRAAPWALAGGFAGVAWIVARHGPAFWTRSMMGAGYTLLAVFFAGLVGHVVTRPDALPARAMAHPALVAVGARSYGLYVLHRVGVVRAVVPLEPLAMGRALLGPGAAASSAEPVGLGIFVALSVAVSFVAAEISLRVLERPFLRLKDTLATPPSQPRDA